MDVSEFLQVHSLRGPRLMWFLGAGASAAGNIQTAWDMIWDFKRRRYCADQRVPIEACVDLADPDLRARLQHFCDSMPGNPPADSPEEYTHYFEKVYPSEKDRQQYIQELVSGGTPSYGHLVLAALMSLDKVRMIWTTNFDKLVEDGVAELLGGSGKLAVVSLDSAHLAIQFLNNAQWPFLVKIHGDFRSSRLKNTTSELRSQDAQLRRALVEACKRQGLAVVGYSGRDDSVMAALEEAIDDGNGYPSGLFWFHRAGSPCLPRVVQLIDAARAAGVEAHLIPVDTFDELMSDLLLLQPSLPESLSQRLNTRRTKVSEVPVAEPGIGWPTIRTNALPLLSVPTVCRRVVCSIGGHRDIASAVERAGVDLVTARRQVGVLAFGRDTDVRQVFSPYSITEFDLHPIEPRRLRYESAEHGLLYEALGRALARARPLLLERWRHSYFLAVDPARINEAILDPLREACGSLTGVVPKTTVQWREAIRIRLEYRLDHAWLLMEPTILCGHPSDEAAKLQIADYTRERAATRYNRRWNDILAAWADILTAGEQTSEMQALGIADGVDATFTIAHLAGFSRRIATS